MSLALATRPQSTAPYHTTIPSRVSTPKAPLCFVREALKYRQRAIEHSTPSKTSDWSLALFAHLAFRPDGEFYATNFDAEDCPKTGTHKSPRQPQGHTQLTLFEQTLLVTEVRNHFFQVFDFKVDSLAGLFQKLHGLVMTDVCDVDAVHRQYGVAHVQLAGQVGGHACEYLADQYGHFVLAAAFDRDAQAGRVCFGDSHKTLRLLGHIVRHQLKFARRGRLHWR
ncbi:hypothetical protein BpHYR1_052461 [Brachionus plicatilis]|uniref:Uncharacterized protein n=1 Tax=Brachionus plicatilis TaxID=10195 RepID=A0A3M7QZE9_BRAPC|nr:hypothetical protein BpHYR1_052461 [Brachionus plicatilis]